MHMENEIWECPDKKDDETEVSNAELRKDIKRLEGDLDDMKCKESVKYFFVWLLLIPLCFLSGFVLSRVL